MATDEKNDMLTPDLRFHLIRKMERHKVVGIAGTELLPHEARYLEFHNVAGVILFSRNVESLSQVTELVEAVTEKLGGEVPPLVMADHEGDFVSELKQIIGVPPSALALAATGDVDLAHAVARETGVAMRKLGANVLLAPVADLYLAFDSAITGLRTFGRDPERVAAFVGATIDGLHEGGLLCCVKHFPGHGATAEDSHETLPEIGATLHAMIDRELLPFRRAIETDVDMVMMSHVAFPMGRDELIPASFDSAIIRALLREKLGFDGVVITDALEMAGARWYATGRYGDLGGFETSLLAGCDLLLHARPVPEQVRMEGESEPIMSINVMDTIIKTLEKVVDRASIDEKLNEAARNNEALGNVLRILDESITRVGALRRGLALYEEAPPKEEKASNVIAFDAYPSVPALYRDVAEASVTAHGEWAGPVAAGERRAVMMPVVWNTAESLHGQDVPAFLDGLNKRFPMWERTAEVVGFISGPDGEARPQFRRRERPTVMDASTYTGEPEVSFELEGDEELVIVFSSRGTPPESFMTGLTAFAEAHDPLAVIVTGWPVVDWLPEGTPALLSLGASTQTALAVAQVLVGEADPAGSLEGLLPPRR